MTGVLNGETITQIAAGVNHSLVLTDSGKLYSWGYNDSGQLGNGTIDNSPVPTAVDMTGVLNGATVTQIAAGEYHSLALTDDGKVHSWGAGAFGQLGNGQAYLNATTPVDVVSYGALDGKAVIQIAAGYSHSLALTSDGGLYSWGANDSGQLGDGTKNFSKAPVAVDMTDVLNGATVTQIAAGGFNSLALTSDGELYSWGANDSGQLGNGTSGTNIESNVPVAVDMTSALDSKTVIQIAAGYSHSLALTSDGGLYSWGDDSMGQLGSGTYTGYYDTPVAVNVDGKIVTQISSSENHSLALTSDGEVYSWGDDSMGQLGDGGSGYYGYTPVAVNNSLINGYIPFTITLGDEYCKDITTGEDNITTGFATNGSWVKCVTPAHSAGPVNVIVSNGVSPPYTLSGAYTYYVPMVITGVTPDHGLALGGQQVQINGASLKIEDKAVTQISGGFYYSLALTNDGQVYSWGHNSTGQLGNGTNGDSPVPVAVDMTGVLNGKTVTQIAAGEYYSLALTSDGKLYSWGYNYNGQLGNGTSGTNTGSSVPVAVDMTDALDGETVTQIAVGYSHSLALTKDGQVYSWGNNGSGQLGNGTTDSSPVPVAVDMTGVLDGKTVTQIAAGGFCSLALTSDGKLYSWGSNGYGQLGNGTSGINTNSPTPVAVDMTGVLNGKTVTQMVAGNAHSLALANDGKLYSWGANNSGQLGNGTNGLTGSSVPVAVDMTGVLNGKTVTQMVAGNTHSLALANDGKLYSWGDNAAGQLGDGTSGTNTESNVPVAVDMTDVLDGKTVTQIAAGEFHLLALASGEIYSWGANDSGQLGNGTTGGISDVPVAVDDSLLNADLPFVITFDNAGTAAICQDIVTGENTITSPESFGPGGSWVKCRTTAHDPGLVSVTVNNGVGSAVVSAVCTDGLQYGGSGGNGGTACNGQLDSSETRNGDRANITSGFLYEEVFISISTNNNMIEVGGSGGITPTSAGAFGTGSNIATTSTNNPTGYSLGISTNLPSSNPNTKDLKHLSLNQYIAATNNACTWNSATKMLDNTASALANNTWGFTLDTTNLGDQKLCQVPSSSSPLTIKQTNVANETGDPTSIFFGAKVDLSKPSGKYRTTVVYTAVAGT
jgi:alpha-tubulin suppressor-like RCC1 family protein